MTTRTRLTVDEAARIMGVTPMFLRMGLRLGRFPFGTAVQMPGGRWSYYINPVRFERYMQGLDMGGGDEDARGADEPPRPDRSEEHTSELQSRENLVCRLLLEKKKLSTILLSMNIEVVSLNMSVNC